MIKERTIIMPIRQLIRQINRITIKLFQQALVDVFLVFFWDLLPVSYIAIYQ